MTAEGLLDFKIADAASYAAHIQNFERFSKVLTKPLAQRMILMANISPAQSVLDVGTGTGVVASEAAKVIGERGECIGIDLSAEMLTAARAAAEAANLASRLEFREMDAESLQFENGRFDVVLSLFALLHFPNPAIALKEMFRVLKPGGILVIAVGSAPSWCSWQGVRHAIDLLPALAARIRGHELVAPQFLEQLVKRIIPGSDQPEESSLARTARNRTRTIRRLIRNAGFVDLRQHGEGHRAVLETPADFWDIQRTFSSVARKRLNRATPNQLAEVKAMFDQLCDKALARGGRLIYPFAAFFVAARRPWQS